MRGHTETTKTKRGEKEKRRRKKGRKGGSSDCVKREGRMMKGECRPKSGPPTETDFSNATGLKLNIEAKEAEKVAKV